MKPRRSDASPPCRPHKRQVFSRRSGPGRGAHPVRALARGVAGPLRPARPTDRIDLAGAEPPSARSALGAACWTSDAGAVVTGSIRSGAPRAGRVSRKAPSSFSCPASCASGTPWARVTSTSSLDQIDRSRRRWPSRHARRRGRSSSSPASSAPASSATPSTAGQRLGLTERGVPPSGGWTTSDAPVGRGGRHRVRPRHGRRPELARAGIPPGRSTASGSLGRHGAAHSTVPTGCSIARVDFDFEPLPVIVEVGGRRGYMSASERQRQERRRNQLQLLGKVVYFFCTEDVVESPGYVVRHPASPPCAEGRMTEPGPSTSRIPGRSGPGSQRSGRVGGGAGQPVRMRMASGGG